jgi:hypothetical protein
MKMDEEVNNIINDMPNNLIKRLQKFKINNVNYASLSSKKYLFNMELTIS